MVITVAPTGPLTTREQHPGRAPLARARSATRWRRRPRPGAAIAHVHARDEAGKPTADPAGLRRASLREIRARCDIVVQASTGVGLRGRRRSGSRSSPRANVDVTMATLNPASMTFADGTFQQSA